MGDSNQTVVAGGVGTAFTVVLLVVYRFVIPFFTAANHKRVRSVCCGRACVSSVDIENTTPVARGDATDHPATTGGGTGVGEKSGVGQPGS
jgi:hypothetical protein